MCLGFVRNFGGFVAVRAVLGIAEGGLLPGMVRQAISIQMKLAKWFVNQVLYLSSFYRRSDMALRIGLFYTAASLSGAFGGTYQSELHHGTFLTGPGLLARGLAAIGPRGGLEGWRWIFIIEGLLVRSVCSPRI
jgi:hypothetical protein